VAQPEVCSSDLCEDAARRMLDALGWEPASVEAVVFVSQTPDYPLPATACLLQNRLGLSKSCAAFDVNQGCSGYIYGLCLSASLVESGLQRVLLLVGDTTTRIVSEQDRSSVFLFGDSGTATAIERKPSDLGFVLGTDGSGAPNLIIPGGQCRSRSSAATLLRKEMEGGNIRSMEELFMNGAEVMAFTLREVPSLWSALLDYSGSTVETFDAVLMHQANQFILDALSKRLGIPKEKAPSSVAEFGNTSCASIPVTMVANLRESLSEKSSRLAMLGFGVGWSWAGCAGEIGPLVVPALGEFSANPTA